MMHDKLIIQKDFRQKILLYNSRLHLFSEKLKSYWTGTYIVHKIYTHGAIEVHNVTDSTIFQVNGHRLKSTVSI